MHTRFIIIGTDFVAMIVFAVASDAVWGRAKAIIIGIRFKMF